MLWITRWKLRSQLSLKTNLLNGGVAVTAHLLVEVLTQLNSPGCVIDVPQRFFEQLLWEVEGRHECDSLMSLLVLSCWHIF